jgi:hypothetical protein
LAQTVIFPSPPLRQASRIDQSIHEHLDEKIDDMMERGMAPEQAENTARREFGNVRQIEERSREAQHGYSRWRL